MVLLKEMNNVTIPIILMVRSIFIYLIYKVMDVLMFVKLKEDIIVKRFSPVKAGAEVKIILKIKIF